LVILSHWLRDLKVSFSLKPHVFHWGARRKVLPLNPKTDCDLQVSVYACTLIFNSIVFHILFIKFDLGLKFFYSLCKHVFPNQFLTKSGLQKCTGVIHVYKRPKSWHFYEALGVNSVSYIAWQSQRHGGSTKLEGPYLRHLMIRWKCGWIIIHQHPLSALRRYSHMQMQLTKTNICICECGS